MDQSGSNNREGGAPQPGSVVLPRRAFTVEFVVGLFALASLAAFAYLAVGLGGINFGAGDYHVFAEFDNISGLEKGASVEIAGVKIGEVVGIDFRDPNAIIKLRIDGDVKIKSDDIASIRTKGIIGDRYVKISRGASEQYLQQNETIIDTESVVDLEDIIGKIVHNLSGGDGGAGE